MDRKRSPGWTQHPGVRSTHNLTLGERAADHMRNGMGSWAFVFAALAFLALWMGMNRDTGFDPYPFILLNLVLSCLAALQGAILLIAAKRSDQIASELAHHDYQKDSKAEALIERLSADLTALAAQHEELHHQVTQLNARLAAAGPGDPEGRAAPLGMPRSSLRAGAVEGTSADGGDEQPP